MALRRAIHRRQGAQYRSRLIQTFISLNQRSYSNVSKLTQRKFYRRVRRNNNRANGCTLIQTYSHSFKRCLFEIVIAIAVGTAIIGPRIASLVHKERRVIKVQA